MYHSIVDYIKKAIIDFCISLKLKRFKERIILKISKMSFESGNSNLSDNTERRQPVLSSILVYLQKNDHADDILSINRLQNGQFRATFRHATINREYVTEIDSIDNLIEYFDTFMMMTVIDRESYDYIQVDIPGMPAVMIRPCRRDWDTLYYRIKNYKNHLNAEKEYKEFYEDTRGRNQHQAQLQKQKLTKKEMEIQRQLETRPRFRNIF